MVLHTHQAISWVPAPLAKPAMALGAVNPPTAAASPERDRASLLSKNKIKKRERRDQMYGQDKYLTSLS